ncbi:MAG TPA: DUF4350 domain-containing protein, partial [Planctomycetota bacterium]|nr:DUF4350 domain-containing protein [Planctomycetota bacterium]
SLLASAWLLATPGDRSPHASVDADGYSRSAIGHFGLIRLLRDLGDNAVQMRLARSLGGCSLLVLAEPGDAKPAETKHVRGWIDDAPATLVVLPKRTGQRDPGQESWIGTLELVAPAEAERVLQAVATWTDERNASALRADAVSDWTVPAGWPVPDLPSPVQLLADAPHVEPLIHAPEGALLANVGGVYVLSDPDLIANHGLLRGDNAALAVAMLHRLRSGDGAIVFDETLHGHRLAPSVFHLARRFPYVLIAVHLLLLAVLIGWIATGRFGAVLPAAPAIGAGKEFLVDNVAALLRRGGDHGPSLRAYGRQRVRLLADALHAPAGLDDERCRRWLLARITDPARRGELEALLHETRKSMPPNRAVAMARRLRELTEEMSHAAS